MNSQELVSILNEQIKNYSNEDLLTYNYTYRGLYNKYPNPYYLYALDRSQQEIIIRGLISKN